MKKGFISARGVAMACGRHVGMFFLLFGCLSLHGQTTISTYFDGVEENKQLNGNILLTDHGKIVYARSFGYADFPTHELNTINAHFNLASISKIFTSTAILQLMEKGKLRLDDRIQTYFPDFPYGDITIRHLLTHTSGLPDLELFEDLVKQYPDTIVTPEILISTLKTWKQPLPFKPGDKFEYCNNGYVLLALLVEKLSHQSFEAYLKEHIFTPAGMTNTWLFDRKRKSVSLQTYPNFYSQEYVRVSMLNRYRYTDYNNSESTGASNIITTVYDLELFDKAFFGVKLLSAASINLALAPLILNDGSTYYEPYMDTMLGEGKSSYGLGWEIFVQGEFGKAVGHGGYKIGLATFYYHLLDQQQTIISFDNTAGPSFGKVVTSALYLMNGKAPLAYDTTQSLASIYATTLVQKGKDEAASQLLLLRTDTAHYYLSEREMNIAGYELMYDDKIPEHLNLTLEIFKLNCFLFPGGFNTYDSYGEAMNKAGHKAAAINLYERSIFLNPGNQGGQRALMELKGR